MCGRFWGIGAVGKNEPLISHSGLKKVLHSHRAVHVIIILLEFKNSKLLSCQIACEMLLRLPD